MLGGGQDAMNVTGTVAREGKFEARFYHKVFEQEVGRVKGHFGPLNCKDDCFPCVPNSLTYHIAIAVHPQGTAYISGGEDGYVRLHHFDRAYFDFLYEVEREQLQASL